MTRRLRHLSRAATSNCPGFLKVVPYFFFSYGILVAWSGIGLELVRNCQKISKNGKTYKILAAWSGIGPELKGKGQEEERKRKEKERKGKEKERKEEAKSSFFSSCCG